MLKVTYEIFDSDEYIVDLGAEKATSLNLMLEWLNVKAKGALREVKIWKWKEGYRICVDFFKEGKKYTMRFVAIENEEGVVFSDGSYFPQKHCARFVQEWLDEKIEELAKPVQYID